MGIMFKVFKKVKHTLSGKRVSKFYLTKKTYDLLYQLLKPKGITLVKCRDGHKMYVDSSYIRMARNLIIDGVWEPFETELFKSRLRRGMKVVDIGAFWGYYTLIAAKAVGEEGKVFAFEPEPHNYNLLVKNVEINGYRNVLPIQKAVSNKEGITKLFLMQDNPGGHTIYPYNSSLQRNFIEVETVSLDEFFRGKTDKIDIIKMDAEGAEFAIFQGMHEMLERSNNLEIFMEFWPEGLRRFGHSPEEFLEELLKYGFNLFYINEQEKKIEAIDLNKCMQLCSGENHINLLCLRF